MANIYRYLIIFTSIFPFINLADEIKVSGLNKPAEIIIDSYGVPHIYAQDHYDVFFVQGFNAARDRLWQIDTWRRRGLGQLSEVLGPTYIEQDRANRLFLYRGDMYREWLSYGSDAKKITQKFTDGINAYIKYIKDNPDKLPIEFKILNYDPSKWEASDIVKIRSHGLWRNVENEVLRTNLLCNYDKKQLQLWKRLEPEWNISLPENFDPCSFGEDILETYILATGPVRFNNISLNANFMHFKDESLGSNNWAVSPKRTNTKSAILANDPHRTHAVPSLRYISHLNGPGINVIGAGEPALPGISIGHNDNIAFGLTIFAIDQEDLYYYDVDDKNSNQYRYKDHYEVIHSVTEEILVRDQDSVVVKLEFTRHGPIIKRDKNRIYALRAAWLDEGMAPYFGSVEYMRSNNWREFLSALNRWGAPAENQVYADKEGNIGYKPAGLFPKRIGYDGLLPVSGHGDYEWNGYFDMDVLPEEYNPDRGYVFTANGMNLPKDYPIKDYPLGFEWSAPWRHRRIDKVLGMQDNHSFDDSLNLQRDYHSVLAEKLIQKLPSTTPDNIKSIFGKWNGYMARDSKEAALFSIWYYRHLNPKLTEIIFGNQSLINSIDSYTVLDLIDNRAYENVILSTLEASFNEAKLLLGENINNWKWGDLHKTNFTHPLLDNEDNIFADIMKIKNYGRGGTGNTPNSTSFSPNDFLVRSGGSWRFVVDTNDWNGARMTNAPGQSGDPSSKFYDNLVDGWANEKSFPLLFTKDAVMENMDSIIKLLPSN